MKISFLFTKLEILTFHHNHPLPTNKTFARMASASNISSSSNGSSYKLSELRKLMAENNLAAYYVPSEDAHQSEYISERDGRRAFISNFTGSAGFAIITMDKAALWTDGRYFLQASKQLTTDWKLMKAGLPETSSKEKWLAEELKDGERVGVDPALISYEAATKLGETLNKSGGKQLVPISENLIDSIWTNQPPFDPKLIDHLSTQFSGKSSAAKVSELRASLKAGGYSAILISALDEIAWIFNLRGKDIDYNPVFFAYALIHAEVDSECLLFIGHDTKTNGEPKLSTSAQSALKLDNVKIENYERTFEVIKELVKEKDLKKILITSTCNWKLVEAIGKERIAVLGNKNSPVETAKAIKNEVEITGFKQCHVRDGAALCRYFAWLESELISGNQNIDEVDGADKLESFRCEGDNFRGLSFDTISGSGPNGAIIHYKPEKPSAALITTDQLYLCDSGAQYLDGTTDVTRTLHFGIPTAYEKECFTRVLKGNLALERAVFPAGTSGLQLDVLARLPLWQAGLDFRHGTGHGVGHYLNVHEGPQSISFRPSSNEAKFVPGMTITDEPGYYEDGKFGIRIENVLIVKKVNTPSNFGNVEFFGFENLTMCPIQQKLLDFSILSQEDINHLNNYHQTVWNNVSPLLQNDLLALKWLQDQCKKIE